MHQSLLDQANMISIRPWRHFQHPRPTKHSISKINEHFGIILPHSLLEFVRCWHFSGHFLASLGPDYESFNHIIRINSYWRNRRRTRRIPRNLVVFNQDHDENYFCFDLDRYESSTGEYAVKYWYPMITEEIIYDSFPDYMNFQLKGYKPTTLQNDGQYGDGEG